MRIIGLSLLMIGFLWIAWDCAEGFVGYQHTRWIWQTQHLPAGESINRTDAAGAMRVLSLDLKDRHREVLVPALAMLVGGLVLGFSRRPTAEHAAPNTPPPSQLPTSPESRTSDPQRTPSAGGCG